MADSCRAKDRSELRLENSGMLEAVTDRAAAEEGIFLMLKSEAGRHLVAANIERSDDEGVGEATFRGMAVVLVLLVLAGRFLAVEKKKLRPEKPDSFGTLSGNFTKIIGKIDIRRERDVASIAGGGNRLTDLLEALGDLLFLLLDPTVFDEGLPAGIDNEKALVAIDQNVLTDANLLGDPLHADDGRNFQRPRQDRGV